MTLATTSKVHAFSRVARAAEATRGRQLVFLVAGVGMIASPQYGGVLFVDPIDQKYLWARAAIQVALTSLVLAETCLVPFESRLVGRRGQQVIDCRSGASVAWVICSSAGALPRPDIAAVIGRIGAGVVPRRFRRQCADVVSRPSRTRKSRRGVMRSCDGELSMLETVRRSAYFHRKLHPLQFDSSFEAVVLFSLLGLVLTVLFAL